MSYDSVNPSGAKELLEGEEPWVYLDVRTVEEFSAGHAPGAYNAPVAFRGPMGMVLNEKFVDAVKASFESTTPLVLGCAAGMRSAHACQLLAQAGFTRLVNMDGGFEGSPDEPGWTACGYEVTRDAPEEKTWAALEQKA